MIYVQEGDTVKIGSSRYVVVEADPGVLYTAHGCFGGFGARRLRSKANMIRHHNPMTRVNGVEYPLDEMFRSLSVQDVETASRNGKIIYRRSEEEEET